MAGKIIADTIQTEASFLQLNVSTTRIATMNASGIYSNTGTKMIGYDGTIGVATIDGSALIDNTVTTAKILDGTITGDKIGVGQITANLFAAGAVSTTSISNGNSNVTITSANSNVSIFASGTERIRVTTDGNVGIGTTSPASILHLEAATCVIRLKDTGASDYAYVGTDDDGSLSLYARTAAGVVDFRTNNTERARITSDGNFAIGTTSAGAKLTIADNTSPRISCQGSGGTIANGGTLVIPITSQGGCIVMVHNSRTSGANQFTSRVFAVCGRAGQGYTVTQLSTKDGDVGKSFTLVANGSNAELLFTNTAGENCDVTFSVIGM